MPMTIPTPTDRRPARLEQATVTGIRPGRHLTVLYAGAGAASKRWVLPVAPDVGGARRRLGSVRRIDQVEFTVDNGKTSARIWGVRHQTPFATAVHPAVALGLTSLGVRTTVERLG